MKGGIGLFETMRAYSGRIFLLDRHLDRLTASVAALGLGPLDREQLAQACRNVVGAAASGDVRVKLTVSSPGGNSHGIEIEAHTASYQPPASAKYAAGYRLLVSSVIRPRSSPLLRHKTTSRADLEAAQAQARSMGFDEALLMNDDGNLTEGAISNLFVVKAGRLLTPPVGDGLLPGVTRGLVMELAAALGVEIVETSLGPLDLDGAAEAFLTNSLMEIMPVASITDDGREWRFEERKLTDRLRATYAAAVASQGGKESHKK